MGTTNGTEKGDVLRNYDPDGAVVHGFGGNDNIETGNGDDLVYGDAGDDEAHVGNGSDTVYGGDGRDILYGNYGDDFLYGGAGDDDIHGTEGTNQCGWPGGRPSLRRSQRQRHYLRREL